jgi:S1-C subfamily serine protease
VRALLGALAVVIAVGGIPGAPLRWVAHVATAPPVPADVTGRDGVVEVTVRAGANGPLLPGARVTALAIIDERAYLADARDTDVAGRVRLSMLPRGEAWILADATGRARGSTHLIVTADPRSVLLELAPEHTFDVVVKDELGAAVAGADVEVVARGEPLPVGARSSGDGVAHMGRLGEGPWRVTARAPGYEDATGRAERDGEVVTLLVRKLGAMAVHVVGQDDRAAAGARVAVAGGMLWPPRAATADEHGDVRIGGLEAGIYALRATKDDTVSPVDFGVPLARGEVKPVVLRLAVGHFVGVRVTDGEGDDADPIAGASVTLAEGGLSPFPLEATTDAKGRARLGPIAPGGASVGARADGFVPHGAVLIADPPPPETHVALVRAGALIGRVVDARGRPIDGATIEIAGTDPNGGPIFDDPRRASFQAAHFEATLGGPAPLVPAGELGVMPGPVPPIPYGGAATAPPGLAASRLAHTRALVPAEPWVTRQDGTFRAAPATPGRIRAIVRHPQYVETESGVVTLVPGGEAHVDIVMHEGGSLEGRVLDARDRPVEGARVVVAATHGTLERETRTANDGSFAFAALPDAVSLTASARDDDEADVRMAIAIPEGSRKEVTIRLAEPRAPLPVTVVDDRGWPVDAAQVGVSSLAADSPLRATAFTDSHGEATLKRARGLALRVEVRAPSHAPRVVVTEGNIDSLRVELAPAESATGEVVAARGRDPVAGADVTLYTDLGVRRARTGAQGSFTLSELAPGNGRLSARAPGFAPVTRSIAVPDSGGRRPYAIPRIELVAEGVVEGDVVDGRGDPVAGARVAQDHVPTWLLVGSTPEGIAVTDARGRFTLPQLPEGTVTLEAYAPGVGRARVAGVKVTAGRTTDRVRIEVASGAADGGATGEPAASGSVAVTLGETAAPQEVVVVSVVEGSEAERAGLAPGDALLAVDGSPVGGIDEARARLSGPISADVVLRIRRADRELVLRVTREAVRR